ncbi:hypothetical protein EYF80_036121 [Liparis tanakae]|uniref:Uncharacterized protein n=1 Tax=Liparis tanakae TaxID=230148 RepID=A0A4Z2GK63_9TELE|nr:hypothetical protein EYF80_036121 [Liparis tanakae]
MPTPWMPMLAGVSMTELPPSSGFMVEHEAQLWQGEAGRPSQTKQGVVEVHGITAQPPVVGGFHAHRKEEKRLDMWRELLVGITLRHKLNEQMSVRASLEAGVGNFSNAEMDSSYPRDKHVVEGSIQLLYRHFDGTLQGYVYTN